MRSRLLALLVLTSWTACAGGKGSPPAGVPGAGAGETRACTSNSDCKEGSYCAKPAGQCQGNGECKVRPEICTQDWRPVCGCDGKTYGNGCGAAAAGTNVAHDGECKGETGACASNNDCKEGSYCAKPAGQCQGNGECQARPEVCTQIWQPVCGCDGKTYGNACGAHVEGTNVAHDGECKNPGS